MSITRRTFITNSTLAATAAAIPLQGCSQIQPAGDVPDYQSWDWVRNQFILSREYRHFACFYIVSHPQPVREAIREWAKRIDRDPFQTVEHYLFDPDDNMQNAVTRAAAAYGGGSAEEYALTSNTTTGLALVYQGLPLQAGDEVLTTTHDHYSHHEAIRLAVEKVGASWRRITLYDDGAHMSPEEVTGRLRAGITAATRVIGITWVHSSSGVRLPIRDLAAMVREVNTQRAPEQQILMLVDGVHGYGSTDEDITQMGCDYFVAGTHKWLLAPRGTGIIWARAENWARLRPTIPTFSAEDPYYFWLQNRKTEGPVHASWVTPGGFFAYEYQWAMHAAYDFHMQIGRNRVAERIAGLNGAIKEELRKIPKVTVHTPQDPQYSAGLVSFEVEGMSPAEVVRKLYAQKIIASESPYSTPYTRLAAGLMNSEEDVEDALRAVRAL